MKELFVFDKIHYVFKITEDYEILFYIDAEKSGINTVDDMDYFYSDSAKYIFSATEVKRPHTVSRYVIRLITSWVTKNKPYYFKYTVNEAKKIDLYSRMAIRLAKELNYYVVLNNMSFLFYKL